MVLCLVKYLWGLATMLVLNSAVSMNVIVYVFLQLLCFTVFKTFADRVISKAQEVCSLANAYYSSNESKSAWRI